MAPNGSRFLAPKGTSWCKVKSAGISNGLDPRDIRKNVGHNGVFDFQRGGGSYHPEYIDASNFSVGVYMNGAGYSKLGTFVEEGGIRFCFQKIETIRSKAIGGIKGGMKRAAFLRHVDVEIRLMNITAIDSR